MKNTPFVPTDAEIDARLNVWMMSDNIDARRFEKRHGTRWMLENRSVVKAGTVRYLQIMDLGLGVIEVRLRPAGKVGTIVVKKWEE